MAKKKKLMQKKIARKVKMKMLRLKKRKKKRNQRQRKLKRLYGIGN